MVAAEAGLERAVAARRGTAVWLLGLTQIVGYGTLYYSFALLAGDMARTLGWQVSSAYAAFSLALLAGGLVSRHVGRMVDRRGGGVVMAAGSAFAAAALLVVAFSTGPATFVAGIVLIQLAGTLVLYDTAFATLAQITGPRAGRSITHLTLIAGFASTLFWPLTDWLHRALDWRTVLVLFAAANLLVCLPAHLVLARAVRAARTAPPAGGGAAQAGPVHAPERPLPAHLQRRAMVLIAAGFSLGGIMMSAILAQMVPLLGALGMGGSAVLVSALFGPSQVFIRFGTMLAGQDRHPIVATLVCITLFPVAAAVLLLTAPSVAGAAVFAVILGFGSGLKSIVQGTLPLAMFGRYGYGERLGRLAAVRLVLSAAAPFALAWLIDVTGPTIALSVMAALGLVGLAAMVEVARLCRHQTEASPQ